MKYMPRPTVARLLAPLASLVFLVMLMGATQLAETITPFLAGVAARATSHGARHGAARRPD